MMVVKDAENVRGHREYYVGQTLGRGMYTHTMYCGWFGPLCTVLAVLAIIFKKDDIFAKTHFHTEVPLV